MHRAVLRGGREVAVKVQRPNVRERVLKDLDALDEVAALMQRFSAATRAVDAQGVLEEFRRTLLLGARLPRRSAKPRRPRTSAARLRPHHRPAAD